MFRRLFYKRKKSDSQSPIAVDTNSKVSKGANVRIVNSSIRLVNSTLNISDFVLIENMNIDLYNADMTIGDYSILKGIIKKGEIGITDGHLTIGNNNSIQADISIRFDGTCKIGEYTAINSGSEIRCDDSISIGSFNMISYNCQINDTNTHNVLTIEERRRQTINEFPAIGGEHTKPQTKPVVIGNDCWFGKGVTILKGVNIGDGALIGTQAVVTKDIPAFSTAVGNPARIITGTAKED